MTVKFTTNQVTKPVQLPADPVLPLARRDIDTGIISVACVDSYTTYLWEVSSYPSGTTPTVATPAAQTTNITLFHRGGHLVRLTVDAGLPTEDVSEIYVGIVLQQSGLCIPALNETVQDNSQPPNDGHRGAEEKITEYLKWLDASIGAGIIRKRTVIDYANCTAVPPSENDGDRYILDKTGAVHANWDGAAQLDIVQYDAGLGLWVAETPSEGWVAYVDLKNTDYVYVNDGVATWEPRVVSVHGISDTAAHTGVSGGTPGNIIELDANNLPADSGKAVSDLQEMDTDYAPHVYVDTVMPVLTANNRIAIWEKSDDGTRYLVYRDTVGAYFAVELN